MRAAVIDNYGPPEIVRIDDVPDPVPSDDEVLVRVRAAAVTSGDARIRAARFPAGFAVPARLAFGVRRPRRRILGSSIAGEVVATGRSVTGFGVGDRVCAMTGTRMGGHAELVAVRAQRLARVPDSVSDDDAAGVLFGGTTALYFLRDRVGVRAGMSVLVNGASGAVGSNAVQLATHFGASVVGVASEPNAALVRELGADSVIDHRTTPVTSLTDRFDVVVDTVGNMRRADGLSLLTDEGVFVMVAAGLADTMRGRGRVIAGTSGERAADFTTLLDLVAGGELVVVHDSTYQLADIVDAYRRVDSGHKVGNVLVRP